MVCHIAKSWLLPVNQLNKSWFFTVNHINKLRFLLLHHPQSWFLMVHYHIFSCTGVGCTCFPIWMCFVSIPEKAYNYWTLSAGIVTCAANSIWYCNPTGVWTVMRFPSPAAAKRSPNAGTMLGQRLQRWPSIEPAVGRPSLGLADRHNLNQTARQACYCMWPHYFSPHFQLVLFYFRPKTACLIYRLKIIIL